MPEHEGRHFEVGCPGCELLEKRAKKAASMKEHFCKADPCPIEGPGCYTQDKIDKEIMDDYWRIVFS